MTKFSDQGSARKNYFKKRLFREFFDVLSGRHTITFLRMRSLLTSRSLSRFRSCRHTDSCLSDWLDSNDDDVKCVRVNGSAIVSYNRSHLSHAFVAKLLFLCAKTDMWRRNETEKPKHDEKEVFFFVVARASSFQWIKITFFGCAQKASTSIEFVAHNFVFTIKFQLARRLFIFSENSLWSRRSFAWRRVAKWKRLPRVSIFASII